MLTLALLSLPDCDKVLLTLGVNKILRFLRDIDIMILSYDSDEMEEACHDLQVAKRLYGKQIANKLHRKISLLDAADTLLHLINFDHRAHWLQGDRQWDFSIPLSNGNSLILKPLHQSSRAPQDHESMIVVKIEDYHD